MRFSKKLLFFVLVVALVLNISVAVYWSATGRSFPMIFSVSLLAWLSYASAHKTVTGRWVDDTQNEVKITESNTKRIFSLIGVLSMVSAFPVGVYGVNQSSFYIIFLAETLFIGGYVVSHQALTGKPL